MKKFRFSLDTVLDYKEQILSSLQVEHGVILAQLRAQEEMLTAVQHQYQNLDQEFCQRKTEGITICDALRYEGGLRSLESNIEREARKLEAVKQKEQAKREQVIEAKIDTSSLDKLRGKKWDAYRKAEQKSEEAFIDELVSATRATAH